MNFDELLWRLRNEPEWTVLIVLILLISIGGGGFYYYRTQQSSQETQRQFNRVLTVYTQANYSGNHENAISRLNSMFNQHQDSGFADKILFFLGKSYLRSGDYISAIKQFRRLIDQHPKSIFHESAFLQIAYAQIERGKLQDSLTALDRVISNTEESSPIWLEALWQKTLVQKKLGNIKAARASIQKLLKQSEEETGFWHEKARRIRASLKS